MICLSTGQELILVGGCEIVAGKFRQMWQATAGTDLTKLLLLLTALTQQVNDEVTLIL